MKRLLNSWPYALGVIGLFGLLWAFELLPVACASRLGGCSGVDDLDWKSLALTLRFVVFPLLVFVGAAVLSFRRGYDWVTLLACFAVGLAVPEPELARGSFALTWIHKDLFFLVIYVVVVHLGVAAGMAARALARRGSLRRGRRRGARVPE